MSESKEGEAVLVPGPQQELPMVPLVLTGDVQDIQTMVQNAERQVEFINKIKTISARVTNTADWINQDGQPYLEISGTMKIRQLWGVEILDQKIEKETIKDSAGEYVMYTCSGKARFQGKEITDIGTCSTRDTLYGKANGTLKELSTVDLENVKKKSVTNYQNRILKKILGLNYTWDELRAAGLNVDAIIGQKVEHAGGKNGNVPVTDEEKKKQAEIGKWLMEISDGNKDEAAVMLAEATTFIGRDNKPVPGVKSLEQLRGTRLNIAHDKVKKIWGEFVKAASAVGA